MEDDLNGRQPQWNTTSIEDELNESQPHRKLTSIEDDINGRLFLNRRSLQWEKASM